MEILGMVMAVLPILIAMGLISITILALLYWIFDWF